MTASAPTPKQQDHPAIAPLASRIGPDRPYLTDMASRAAIPLRAVARQLRVVALPRQPCRTAVSSSKPSAYTPRSATTKPSSSSSTTAAKTTSTYRAASSTASKPASSSAKPAPDAPAATATHTPVSQVSGEPLPAAGEALDPETGAPINWASSFHGLGTSTFGPEVAARLQAPLDADDIEVKPDGIIYLPEIKYRRVLNAAFGPGGWGLAPRGDLVVTDRMVYREYALVAHGRFVDGIPRVQLTT